MILSKALRICDLNSFKCRSLITDRYFNLFFEGFVFGLLYAWFGNVFLHLLMLIQSFLPDVAWSGHGLVLFGMCLSLFRGVVALSYLFRGILLLNLRL